MGFHRDDVPLLASGGGAGAGWAAFKIVTNGDIVVVDLRADDAGTTQAAAYLFDAADNLLFGFSFTSVGYPAEGILVDVNPPAGQNIHYDTTAPTTTGGWMGVGLTLNDPDFGAGQAGTFKLLVWAAGDLSSHAWAVRGGAGTTLAGTESGSSAWLYGAEDFTGLANAQAYQQGVGGRATATTQKVVDVENKLYGVFYDANFKIACAVACAGAPGTQAMTTTDPAGNVAACICGFYGEDAGTYTFGLSGADASSSQWVFQCVPTPAGYACGGVIPSNDAVILGIADAKLPA